MKTRKGILILLLSAVFFIGVTCAKPAAAEEAESSGPVAAAGQWAQVTELREMGYEDKLFDRSFVHTIEITMSDSDWEDLKQNALQKTKYTADITIDGESLPEVSFAAKGNSSLSSVYSSGSKRFSFKVNFGKNIKGQRYYGLHKLNLSNMYLDATFMKDYLCFRIFEEAGVPAPLTSYVQLSVNGEVMGLYLAIEDIGDSFRERLLKDEGEIYKPESDENNLAGAAPGGGGGGSRGGSNGGSNTGSNGSGDGTDLVYIGDDLTSYAAIFDNAETTVEEEDMYRVIAALKLLSEGAYEEALYTDEIIRYFAAHNFTVNYDSMTSNRTHNYYLYENEGRLAVFPWDYNEAFGAHGQVGKASDVVNTAIDTPLYGPSEEERPLWSWIVSDPAYLEAYHSVLQSLMDDYFFSGTCEAELAGVYEMIRPYIENDPTAFYSVGQFDKAYETLQIFCGLRAESIQKQLDGELASRTQEQEASDLVDASAISIGDMGGKTSR